MMVCYLIIKILSFKLCSNFLYERYKIFSEIFPISVNKLTIIYDVSDNYTCKFCEDKYSISMFDSPNLFKLTNTSVLNVATTTSIPVLMF